MMFAAFIQSVAGSSRSFRKSFNATDSRSRGGSAAFHPSSIAHVWDPDSLVEVPAMDLPAGPRLRLVRRWLSPSSGASPGNLLSFFQEIGHRPGLGYLMVDMLHESLLAQAIIELRCSPSGTSELTGHVALTVLRHIAVFCPNKHVLESEVQARTPSTVLVASSSLDCQDLACSPFHAGSEDISTATVSTNTGHSRVKLFMLRLKC
ncbi:hypothetical protein SMMN14_09646 [Sphaerulina musiva]